MQIVVINKSKRITNTQASLMTQACALQLSRHAAPAWGFSPIPVVFATNGDHLPADACPITLLDVADDPGALGYHTEENNKVWGRIFVNPVLDDGQGCILYDPRNPQNCSVASVLSHEVLELFVDQPCNLWADGPGDKQYSYEVCDPVEADLYNITVPSSTGPAIVAVSNFVFPEWFDPQATQPGIRYDYMRKLHAPFTMTPGGYMVVRTGLGREKQVNGSRAPWRTGIRNAEVSRSARRLG